MRTILLPLLSLALPCMGQSTTSSTSAGKSCSLRPLSAATDGERVRVAWASPACELASVRVYRRRQHVGTEAEIHPVIFFGTRHDTTIVQCWDTLFTELGIYEYRLMPVDSAGREGPSSPWTTAHNLHEEARPWLRSIHAEDVPGARSIRLRWALENPERARGIAIHRAEKFDGPYLRLADVDAADTVYVDRVQRVKETYFYRVEVIDVVGNSTVSMPVQGLSNTAPPAAPPSGVIAKAELYGVTLYWPHGGPDIAYYQVERGAPREEKYVLVADGIRASSAGPVQWTDSAATDRGVMSYRVRAVGIGGTISEPSENVTIQAVDGRTPTTPTEVAVRLLDDTVMISWRDPWAGAPGAFQTNVERADAGSTEFKVMNTQPLEPGITVFKDPSATANRSYTYRVVGVSFTGTRGVPSASVVLVGDDPAAQVPRMMMAHRTAKGIALEWAARERHGKGFNLYRAVDNGEPELLKSLPIDASGYTDGSTAAGALHLYVLRLVLPDGTESGASEPVSMRW